MSPPETTAGPIRAPGAARTSGVARTVSTAVVASIAAWSSWSHMVHVALRYGERPEVAYVLPLSVDGMLVVASTVMVDDKRSGRPVRWSARVAFTAGVAASVAANIAAAAPSLGARVVAAWPAVALLLVVEMLTRTPGERTSGRARTDMDAGAPVLEVDIALEASDAASPAGSVSGSGTSGQRGGRSRRPAGRTAEAIADIRARRPDASVADIAAAVGVSERHVRRLITG